MISSESATLNNNNQEQQRFNAAKRSPPVDLKKADSALGDSLTDLLPDAGAVADLIIPTRQLTLNYTPDLVSFKIPTATLYGYHEAHEIDPFAFPMPHLFPTLATGLTYPSSPFDSHAFALDPLVFPPIDLPSTITSENSSTVTGHCNDSDNLLFDLSPSESDIFQVDYDGLLWHENPLYFACLTVSQSIESLYFDAASSFPASYSLATCHFAIESDLSQHMNTMQGQVSLPVPIVSHCQGTSNTFLDVAPILERHERAEDSHSFSTHLKFLDSNRLRVKPGAKRFIKSISRKAKRFYNEIRMFMKASFNVKQH